VSELQAVSAVLRGSHVAALVSLFGTLLFLAVIAPGEALRLRDMLRRLARASAACALSIGLGWFLAESAAIAGAGSMAATLTAVPVVAFQTQYGRWFVLRCALLAVVLALPYGRRAGLGTALAGAGAALAVQPMLGHAGALGGDVGAELIGSEILHLLAAGAWLGGLLPLFISIGMLPHEAAAAACRGFTPIGLAAVLLLAGTAVVQVTALMGGLPGLLGTEYGHVALVKLALFLGLLVLAALNRFAFTDRLAGSPLPRARRHMRISILIEMVLGAAVILVAGFLGSLMPGTHEQPVWPFPWRPSLAALADPLLRGPLIAALIAIGVAAGAVVSGLIWRRIRWYAFALAVVLSALAFPRLGLLLIDAYPTSFFTSPTEFAATAIAHGARLFAADCAACHGADGRGDGPAARALPLAPADLTAPHFWMHSAGDLYWFIAHGFTAPDGGTAMPAFAGKLSSEAIWDLIDYLRAHNAGLAMRQTGNWPQPIAVPQFDARCASGRVVDLDDLRGRAIRLVALADDREAEPAAPDVDATTIVVARGAGPEPSDDTCVAVEPQTWTAMAIILGVPPDGLAGAQVLADPNGWLRAAWLPGTNGQLDDPRALRARVRDIMEHPLVITAPAGHHH
jgi:putative copper export protein/mono/diheme cytochrome c family protein